MISALQSSQVTTCNAQRISPQMMLLELCAGCVEMSDEVNHLLCKLEISPEERYQRCEWLVSGPLREVRQA